MQFNEQIGQIVTDWERMVRPEDAAQFEPFAERIRQFYEFRKELARLGTEVGQAAGREWGDNDANRHRAHRAEQGPRDAWRRLLPSRRGRPMRRSTPASHFTAWLMSVLGVLAVLLAAVGV